MAQMPAWLLGLANSLIVLVVYGALGLLGLFLARRLGLPGIYREEAGRRALWLTPLWLGLLLGAALTLVDWLFSLGRAWEGFAHPTFPLSLFASISAGIGEEILFRLFVLSLWAFMINLLLRVRGGRTAALWVGNAFAALAFAAGHLPALMMLTGASSPAELPALALVELVLLNGIIGLVAGQQFIKNGLVAAVGIHFWADVAWHVVLPLVVG
jgi:hypothetical protein